MKIKDPNMPWRLLWRSILSQLISLFILLVLVGLTAHFIFQEYFDSSLPSSSSEAQFFDRVLLFIFFLIFVGQFLITYYFTRPLLLPLGRLIIKARYLTRRTSELTAHITPDEAASDEPEEWSELEVELDRIGKSLRTEKERRKQETSKMESLMAAVSTPIVAVNRHQEIQFYNQPFANQLLKKSLRDKTPGITQVFRSPDILKSFMDAIENRKSITIHEWIGKSYYLISIAPIQNDQIGAETGAIGVFQNITEIKRAEQIRVDFVANVSHELRTPLTSIKGYADTIKGDFKSGNLEDLEKHIGVIVRNADRLNTLVNDLLDLSTLDSGAELHPSWAETREITERIIGQLERKISAKKIQIETHFEAAQVYADPKRLEQILTNLIDNAVKYIPTGKLITIDWRSAPNGEVHLYIKDNGPGIEAEHLSRIFERFYRVDKARSRELGGTGLGLAIVKHIVQSHGGTVSVSSTVGEGTEFICSFPDKIEAPSTDL